MTKIEALKKTIYNLENNVYEYCWMSVNNCNCGIVARTILGGRSPSDCGFWKSPAKEPNEKGAFSRYAYCLTTNLPLPEVFHALKDSGFTYEELDALEYLGNPNIMKAARLTKSDFYDHAFEYHSKDNLIAYLRAWVEMLERKPVLPSYPDISKQLSDIKQVEERSDVASVRQDSIVLCDAPFNTCNTNQQWN